MKVFLLTAVLTLAGCDQLTGLLAASPVKLPTPAQVCGLSDATKAALASAMHTDLASLTAACEIAG